VSSIKAFIDDFKAGRAKQDFKSETEKTVHDDVFTIVGTNHDQIVNDGSRDVFVFYFATYNRQCVELFSLWDELAQYTKPSEDLMITRFNVPENEVQGLVVPKMPYFKLYPKGNKDGIVFTEEPTMENFKVFLN
jgi:protein disulfide-isomerase A1